MDNSKNSAQKKSKQARKQARKTISMIQAVARL
jgi:hypothetical protein